MFELAGALSCGGSLQQQTPTHHANEWPVFGAELPMQSSGRPPHVVFAATSSTHEHLSEVVVAVSACGEHAAAS
eukprot:5475138-Amphidinium_carterae.2